MNAYKFVEQYGLERAKKVLSKIPEPGWATHFHSDKPSRYANTKINIDFICLEELRQAIADFELIKIWGGDLEGAIKTLNDAKKEGFEEFEHRWIDEISVKTIDLEKAITRIEGGLRDE